MSKKTLNVAAITNELEGASLFFKPVSSTLKHNESHNKLQTAKLPKSVTHRVRKSVTTRVPNLQTSEVPESVSLEVLDLSAYPIVGFQDLARMELRLTWEQKEYLDRVETAIARNSGGVAKNDPESQRLTKNSLLRALVEIARQLNLGVDSDNFRNERDLIQALFDTLKDAMSKKQTSEVTESVTNRLSDSQSSKLSKSV